MIADTFDDGVYEGPSNVKDVNLVKKLEYPKLVFVLEDLTAGEVCWEAPRQAVRGFGNKLSKRRRTDPGAEARGTDRGAETTEPRGIESSHHASAVTRSRG